MQLSSIPAKFLLPFAQNDANRVEIPVTTSDATRASQSLGFPPLTMQPVAAGGVPPQGEDFNGAMNQVARTAWWLMAGGRYPFDSVFAAASQIGGYPAGALILSADGLRRLMSRIDNNTSDPSTASGNWAAPNNPGYEINAPASTVALTDQQVASSYLRATGAVPSAGSTWTLPALNGGRAPAEFNFAHDGTGGPVIISNSGATSTLTAYPGQRLNVQQRNDGTLFDVMGSAAPATAATQPNLLPNGSAEFGPINWTFALTFGAYSDATGGYGTYFSNGTSLTTQTASVATSPKAPVGAGVSVSGAVDIDTTNATAGSVSAQLIAYNGGTSLGVFGSVATVGFGTSSARYAFSGTTPASTTSIAVQISITGASAPAQGIRFRRGKIQAGTQPTAYSQEADFATTFNTPALAVGSGTAAHGTIGVQGYELRPNGTIRQWVTMQLQDNGNGAALDTWTYPIPFPTAVTAIRGTNLQRAAGQTATGQMQAVLTPGLPGLTSVALGINNTSSTGTQGWMLVEVEGY